MSLARGWVERGRGRGAGGHWGGGVDSAGGLRAWVAAAAGVGRGRRDPGSLNRRLAAAATSPTDDWGDKLE